jgi:hypothetical protein
MEEGYYYPPPPKRHLNKPMIGALIVFIIIVILLVVSILIPWYNVHSDFDGEMSGTSNGVPISADFDGTIDIDMFLQEEKFKMTGEVSARGQSQTMTESSTDQYDDDVLKNSMNITLVLIVISFLFFIIILITSSLVLFDKFSHKLNIVISIIALVFILITLVYFPLDFPRALKESLDDSESSNELNQAGLEYDGSFIGSSSGKIDMAGYIEDAEGLEEMPMDMNWSWGPSMGWYLILVSFVMAMVGVILMGGSGRGAPPRRMPPPPRGYQEPPYGPSREQPPPPRQDYYDNRPRDRYYDSRPRDDYNRY